MRWGLCAVLAAREKGAERIIAMSRHEPRQKLAREFGATDIVTERGDEGVAVIKEMTEGVGADAVLECVGTGQAMQQAIHSARPGAFVGFVGVPHDVAITGEQLFSRQVGLHGGPAPSGTSCPPSSSWCSTEESTPARCLICASPSSRSPRPTGPWMSGAPSKPSYCPR